MIIHDQPMDSMVPTVRFKKTDHDVRNPLLGTSGSACWDLHAYLPNSRKIDSYSFTSNEPCTVIAGEGGLQILHLSRYVIPTGLMFEIPKDYVMKIYTRSGIAIKKGLNLVNGVAIIDSDFRGEVKILMVNLGARTFISHGERIAQMEICPVENFVFSEVSDLSETKRGDGGLGSTGS